MAIVNDQDQDQRLARDRALIAEFRETVPGPDQQLLLVRLLFRRIREMVACKYRYRVHVPPSESLDEEEQFQQVRGWLLDSLDLSGRTELRPRIEPMLPKLLIDVTHGRTQWDNEVAVDIDAELTRLCHRARVLRFKEIPSWYFHRTEYAVERIISETQSEALRKSRPPFVPWKEFLDRAVQRDLARSPAHLRLAFSRTPSVPTDEVVSSWFPAAQPASDTTMNEQDTDPAQAPATPLLGSVEADLVVVEANGAPAPLRSGSRGGRRRLTQEFFEEQVREVKSWLAVYYEDHDDTPTQAVFFEKCGGKWNKSTWCYWGKRLGATYAEICEEVKRDARRRTRSIRAGE